MKEKKTFRTWDQLAMLIRTRRRKLNLSQDGLANLMGFKNGQYISNIERNLCGLSSQYIQKLADILDIPVSLVADCYKTDYVNSIDGELELQMKAKWSSGDCRPQEIQ